MTSKGLTDGWVNNIKPFTTLVRLLWLLDKQECIIHSSKCDEPHYTHHLFKTYMSNKMCATWRAGSVYLSGAPAIKPSFFVDFMLLSCYFYMWCFIFWVLLFVFLLFSHGVIRLFSTCIWMFHCNLFLYNKELIIGFGNKNCFLIEIFLLIRHYINMQEDIKSVSFVINFYLQGMQNYVYQNRICSFWKLESLLFSSFGVQTAVCVFP